MLPLPGQPVVMGPSAVHFFSAGTVLRVYGCAGQNNGVSVSSTISLALIQ
jgi:hypothetical protein